MFMSHLSQLAFKPSYNKNCINKFTIYDSLRNIPAYFLFEACALKRDDKI